MTTGQLAVVRDPSATRSAYPSRLLVVDDSEPYRKAMVSALGSFGHTVESAADGPEAVAKMRLGIDLILLDADMPGMDGFDVARAVRDDPDSASTPIIMVTGLGDREDRLRALEVGVNDFDPSLRAMREGREAAEKEEQPLRKGDDETSSRRFGKQWNEDEGAVDLERKAREGDWS